MKKIATKTTTKGKKSVILDIFDSECMLTYANSKDNYYKIVRITNYDKALYLFYEWSLNINSIKIDTTLY